MKLEIRSRGFYESAVNTSPKIECLLQNQIFILELLLAIWDRVSPAIGPIEGRDASAKEADPTKFKSHTPILDRYNASVESETVIKMDRTNKTTATGESDFEKQKKEISDRARRAIEEEPL